jgi:hypothetical protein
VIRTKGPAPILRLGHIHRRGFDPSVAKFFDHQYELSQGWGYQSEYGVLSLKAS